MPPPSAPDAPSDSAADDEADDLPRGLATLRDAFADHPHVASVEADTTRRPPRLGVTLHGRTVTPGLQDILESHEPTIEYIDDEADDTGLYIELRAQEPLHAAGANQLRMHGTTSVVITITREALERSGFEVGDELALDARNGEIRLTRRGP